MIWPRTPVSLSPRRSAPIALATLVLACAVIASCGRESPQEPRAESFLQVYVHWDNVGLANKRLEVLELGVEKRTDANGIAVFSIPEGHYTLRAHEINDGGPPLEHIDLAVTTIRGEKTHVDIIDCLLCVTPSVAS